MIHKTFIHLIVLFLVLTFLSGCSRAKNSASEDNKTKPTESKAVTVSPTEISTTMPVTSSSPTLIPTQTQTELASPSPVPPDNSSPTTTPVFTATPTLKAATPTAIPTLSLTSTPSPTNSPASSTTPIPTRLPTREATVTPTSSPLSPTESLSPAPTITPTLMPTEKPTPSSVPSMTPTPAITIGDTIKFGKYPQDNNWTKKSIEWLVLDIQGGKALLISKYGLESMPYNSTNTSVSWEKCSLRAWLNSDFIGKAFSSGEQRRIAETNVINPRNETSGVSGGRNTVDRVFLLSLDEANRYFSSNDARCCKPTDYAVNVGVVRSDGNCPWLLRSPGASSKYSSCVKVNGVVDASGTLYHNGASRNVSSYFDAVRPAMWVYIDGTELSVATISEPRKSLAAGEVEINQNTFPGYGFRAFVLNEVDRNRDRILNVSEIEQFTGGIDSSIIKGDVANFKGIEYFPSLSSLKCPSLGITELDLSNNKNLMYLICSGNKLTSLDVSMMPRLQHLECSDNNIASLDVSKNTDLYYLYCDRNQLTTLDLSKHTHLRGVTCWGNPNLRITIYTPTEMGIDSCVLEASAGASVKIVYDIDSAGEEGQWYYYCEGFVSEVAFSQEDANFSCQGEKTNCLSVVVPSRYVDGYSIFCRFSASRSGKIYLKPRL